MPMTSNTYNYFLVDLLALQQDGKQAISAPTNWTTQEPLLEVSTDIDEIVEELGRVILLGNESNTIARWHFFIGSPGNGKSAAIGKLCRHLIREKGCQVRDESGCSIQDLQPAAIPYALDVYEGGNKFASARIVQDASVVRNPFSPDVDPAAELVSTLVEAWDRGISLIICTNRGVLEKAHRDSHTNPEVNTKSWFKVLKEIVVSELGLRGILEGERNFSVHKPVFEKAKISYSHLDNYSLLLGRDIFTRLVQKAIHLDHWMPCNTCAVKDVCPFKLNRDWLSDPVGLKNFLLTLQRAEALSGQVIVFREALALISLVLAGCPRDYANGHPCDWVKGKASSGDVFSIAMRRIYMSIYTSFAPLGFEIPTTLKERQKKAIHGIMESIGESDQDIKKTLRRVLNDPPPSIDVGLSRLLGKEGVLLQIDPCQEPLPAGFYDSWDSDFSIIQGHENPLITRVERRCAEIWALLEQVIESTPDHTVSDSHWALRRWSSNFTLHLGALLEGKTAWSSELSEFLKTLEIIFKDPSDRTKEEKRAIHDLNEKLEIFLESASNDRQPKGAIQLSETVNLAGTWVKEYLKPTIAQGKKPGSLSLLVQFKGGESARLGALMFLWLARRARGRLDPRCFPTDLLTGAIDARIRAAAKGNYAYQNEDIELEINTGKGESFRLVRLTGDVDIEHERI